MHDGSQRQDPRTVFISCVVSVTAQRGKLREICARVRSLYPERGAVVILGAGRGPPSGAESRGHSSLERASVQRRHAQVPLATLVLLASDRCGPHAPPCPPLPSCDRAVPELIAPGPAGAVSGATGPTPLALDGPLQPPPSCGLAPAQAKSEARGRGAPASRPRA